MFFPSALLILILLNLTIILYYYSPRLVNKKAETQEVSKVQLADGKARN